MEEIKILILDIDGTLTNSRKEISEKTRNSLLEIQKRGHTVMLASGRPAKGMQRYEKELELENYGGYLLSFNGGRIIDCRSGEILYQKTLPPQVLPGLYRFACEKDCGLITYYGDSILLGTRMDAYIELESRINGMEVRRVPDFLGFVDFEVNKCLMTAPPERAEKYAAQLKEKYGDIMSIYRSEPFFIEIMPKGVDKASSIDRMLRSVGLKRENTICCGDGFNDATMIEYAGVGVAMANAQEAVKEKADYITGSNEEDGIVEVIERFVWKKGEAHE